MGNVNGKRSSNKDGTIEGCIDDFKLDPYLKMSEIDQLYDIVRNAQHDSSDEELLHQFVEKQLSEGEESTRRLKAVLGNDTEAGIRLLLLGGANQSSAKMAPPPPMTSITIVKDPRKPVSFTSARTA